MNIIGISAFYHDSACCLLQNGRLVAAASEERFSRIKNDPGLPRAAFRYCLNAAGLQITDIQALAYYESPVKKLSRQLWSGLPSDSPSALDPHRVERTLREDLGWQGQLLFFDHHQSHAASSFYYSGFDRAAFMTVDGVGEWATTTYGLGKDNDLNLLEQVDFPHSLGLLYATLTSYLGFRVNSGEYKVMGLAPYGRPRYAKQIYQLIESGQGGQFRLNMDYFDYVQGGQMYAPALIELLGQPARQPESQLGPFHKDVAASLQQVLEDILLEKATWLAGKTQSPNLCLAGGVALNCVANGRILRESPFENLFVQPAAGDAGSALGAAALAHRHLSGSRPYRKRLAHVYLGPSWASDQIKPLLDDAGLAAHDYRDRTDDLIADICARLQQKQVIGWFHGRMELGPRALGARSILANPLDPDIRQHLNNLVKKREAFRPFAPSVLAQHAAQHFDLDCPSPFMLQVCQVTSELELPGITHVNGSARPQTVHAEHNQRYAALIEAFYRATGCPMLVNTSFNVRGEPIVCSPVDALFCMAHSGVDVLVLEDFVITRDMLPQHLELLLPHWEIVRNSAYAGKRSGISDVLYTFV